MFFVYGVIVFILLIVIIKSFSKSPEKYYKKAAKLHKKGEKYYNLGDDELAEDYYQESELLRKKAEEMKGVI
jgi:uncharacterized protein HemY